MQATFKDLKISLAAKCQLLFGVAVALIIGAALLAPWQRMEELMEELDRRGARTLTDNALAEHVVAMSERTQGVVAVGGPTTTRAAAEASTRPAGAPPGTRPTSRPEAGASTQPLTLGREVFYVPRLAGAWREDLSLSERRALSRFSRRPDEESRAFYYTRRDGSPGYRFTRAVYARGECLACHTEYSEVALSVAETAAANAQMLRLPKGLMGTVTVDLASQKETKQVLLNRVFFLSAGLLAGALAIIVFSVITYRFILQPVRVLQETAEKVSEGDLDIRSHIGSGDEFQQLSETFNTMLANLQRSEEQLRAVNRSLDVRLTQLSETNVALAETNRLKSEFLANVSHELKTPLNSILGFAELLRKAAEGAQDARGSRYAQNIYASGSALLALITDLLDLAKVEAGRMEVRPERLTLGEVFETLVSVLKPLTEPKGVTIVPEVEAGVPILVQDASKLQQILYNFLSNAIKFSPTGGQILLRAAMEQEEGETAGSDAPSASDHGEATPEGGPEADANSQVRISVTDQGPGIEPDKHRVIFEKFRQLDGSVTRQHGGTGLGLAISKELTSLLGGRIGVVSDVGEGATFYVILPVRIESDPSDLRRSVQQSGAA